MVKVEAYGTKTSQINRVVLMPPGMGFSRVLEDEDLTYLTPILVLVPLLMHLNH